MFKKLLNVGKGHSTETRLQHQQQHQLQQKNLFQLNEIRSYGFSHLCCLGYSQTLSLLAVGSKNGLLRVLGNPSVEFSYQLEVTNAIRQIEFIDCRDLAASPSSGNKQDKKQQQQQSRQEQSKGVTAKLVVLTDNGQLHLFELKTVKPPYFSDSTTQTEAQANANDCCSPKANNVAVQQQDLTSLEYTTLGYVSHLDYFTFRLDDEDRSKRVTTLEISADGQIVFVGTEGGNLYQVPLDKFEDIKEQQKSHEELCNLNTSGSVQRETGIRQILDDIKLECSNDGLKPKNGDEDETTVMNLNDEPQIEQGDSDEPFGMIMFENDVAPQLGDEIKPKKQGAVESIKRHPVSSDRLLISYHRGLSVIYNFRAKQVDRYFYHNQILESSCFASGQNGDDFYTSHNDGSYIKWDTKKGSLSKADDEYIRQLYGPYPCKPTTKIQSFTGLVNDQPEDLVIFSGGMPRATYDDKNPVTIVRAEQSGKDSIKVVLDFTSKVLDFVVITRPRGSLGIGTKVGGGGGKKNKNKQQQQQQLQRNQPIAVALAILADEEFVVIDLLNSESFLEFPLPYLNCVQPSAITCNQHYSDISNQLYEQLLNFNKQYIKDKFSQNDWPIQGGKVITAPEVKSHDILLTGHEDGSINIWDVSEFSMRHLLHVPTGRFFSSDDDDLPPIDENQENGSPKDESSDQQDEASSWPPLKRVGRFDPFSDDTRLAIRKISLCAQTGTLLVAGTGGQVLVFELNNQVGELEVDDSFVDEVNLVTDQRLVWKGREKLVAKSGLHKMDPGYQLVSYVQLNPPAFATSTDLRSDWHLFAVGTSYGFLLYDYKSKHTVVSRCTLNIQDFAIVGGDAGAMSRKKSFRKSLRESFRRLRRGRSQRNQPVSPNLTGDEDNRKPFGRTATAVRTLAASTNDTAQQAAVAHRNLFSGERQVEPKVELSSIVKCLTLTSAVITNNLSLFKPSLWVGTNSGQVLVYAIDLASKQREKSAGQSTSGSVSVSGSDYQTQESSSVSIASSKTVARLTKEIQLKHKAPIVAIFTSPEAAQQISATQTDGSTDDKSTPLKHPSDLFQSSASTSELKSSAIEADNNEVSISEQHRASTPLVDKSPSKASQKDYQPTQQQPRVLICSEEQFKVFNLPNLKPFCKFKLTANEGLRAKKISITQFLKSSHVSNNSSVGGSSRLPSTTTVNTSKSLQSFATQTSPSASPVPPAEVADSATGLQQRQGSANGADTTASKQAESNNNSLLAPNNNNLTKKQQDKELLNAKFGAKANPSSHPTTSSFQEDKPTDESSDGAIFEPYMVCMSNQGDCAIYSVPDLKRQAQIQVCKREDVNGITSAMLTNYGEGYYLRSSSNFLRFSISSQRVLRVLAVV